MFIVAYSSRGYQPHSRGDMAAGKKGHDCVAGGQVGTLHPQSESRE